MRKRKHFVLREGISFLVRTENEEVEFGYPYENERTYDSFEKSKALEKLGRVAEIVKEV